MRRFAVFFPFLILVSAVLRTPVCTALTKADFEGRWSSGDNEITITNVTEKSFEFSFEGFYITPAGVPHMGDLEGTALFTEESKAIFDYEDEDGDKTVKFEFVINEDELSVSVTEGDETGLFGAGVYMNGKYTKFSAGAP